MEPSLSFPKPKEKNILYFSDLKPHAKFLNPMIKPSGRKVSVEEREEENPH
jgi:hypothetical protein